MQPVIFAPERLTDIMTAAGKYLSFEENNP